MHEFPNEFADLLNARGRKLLASRPKFEAFVKRGKTPIVVLDDLIDKRVARDAVAILDRAIYPTLKRMETPVPREWLTGMKKNYSEALRKTVRVRTVTWNSAKSKSLEIANEVGLAPMMRSESFHAFAEAVVGGSLRRDHWGRQVICYQQGDYSGPHNDHHPERPEACNGFVDLHVMFSNDAVHSQWLVYEENRFLSASHEVAGPSGIAVYRLPFWHYTTPLVGRKGREAEARRWLLLGSFDYDPPLAKLSY